VRPLRLHDRVASVLDGMDESVLDTAGAFREAVNEAGAGW